MTRRRSMSYGGLRRGGVQDAPPSFCCPAERIQDHRIIHTILESLTLPRMTNGVNPPFFSSLSSPTRSGIQIENRKMFFCSFLDSRLRGNDSEGGGNDKEKGKNDEGELESFQPGDAQ